MGQNNSTDLRKSYHSLPQLVGHFQDNNQNDSFEVQTKRKLQNLTSQNEYYSFAEQKSKLMTTITLNDFNEAAHQFDTENLLAKFEMNQAIGENYEEDNTIEGQSEDSFKMQMSPYRGDNIKRRANLEETKNSHRLNDSQIGIRDTMQKNDVPYRQLRAGSFKSLQGGFDEESGDDGVYLNFPREKLDHNYIERPSNEPMPPKKLSCATDTFNPADQNLSKTNDPHHMEPDLEAHQTDKYHGLNRSHHVDTSDNSIDFNKMIRVTSIPLQRDDKSAFSKMKTAEVGNQESQLDMDQDSEAKREEIIELRRKFLEQKKKERKTKVKEDTLYKYNLDDMIAKVSRIIHKHILFAEEHMKRVSQGAMLFDERIYKRERWMVHTTHGYSGTLPVFLYSLEKVEYETKQCTPEDIIKFIKRIFVDLQLAIECILIMLIYIERVMTIGGVEIRSLNWKPLVFIGILLASKFWEDLNFWNVDFVGVGQSYSLEGINQMENEFLALCKYELFVSATLYARYYFAVRDKFNVQTKVKPRIKNLNFDRFKLRQSRAGYDHEVSDHYKSSSHSLFGGTCSKSVLKPKKIDVNFPEEHQKPLLDNY